MLTNVRLMVWPAIMTIQRVKASAFAQDERRARLLQAKGRFYNDKSLRDNLPFVRFGGK